MNNQITTRDIMLLSGYLDNQLNSKERTKLESRLKADPALRQALQEINQTRTLLRQLPQKRAPRNYYLKPEVVRAKPGFRLAPIFGMVSAVATVLLAVVLIGSRFISTPTQVAMAPVSKVAEPTIAIQAETNRSISPTIPPTEEAPAAAMSAPAVLPSSTPFSLSTEVIPTLPATPTTIYLFAYPPTSTPEGSSSIAGINPETPTATCEYYYGTEPLPDWPDIYICVTPSATSEQYLEGILPSVITTTTPTVTSSPTLTNTPLDTETPTPSPTPTETPTPTYTPSPSATPEPPMTENPPSALKLAPSTEIGSNTDMNQTEQELGSGNSAEATPQQIEETTSAESTSFLHYILLSIEISLAAIAVLAGLTAIILRIRAH